MRLPPLPDSFVATRDALHQIAFFALGPARYRTEGRMGLRATPGGFGTPRHDGRVARVEGDILILETADASASQTITTVRAACRFLGQDYAVDWFTGFRDPLTPVDPDADLPVDDAAGRALGNWFGFGTDVLDRVCAHASPEDDPSPVQLWPEHFDPATEVGDQTRGQRASYGASPGDGGHDEPYVYVSPWGEVDRSDPYWNDDAFGGSSLSYSELALTEDPVTRALEFLLEGHRALHQV